MTRAMLLTVPALLLGIAAARADEAQIHLKDAPGHETVETVCSVCHSLDYIRINAPFLTEQGWQAEVGKMVKIFGAPATPEEAQAISTYLAKNYGKPPG
jgi:hypothetical protein